MTAITKTRHTRTRAQMTTYWIATALLVAELTLGGIWDVLRIPLVRNVVTHLGYPTYLLVLLGTWKLLGAAALIVPRLPLVKEWAYAGTFFVFSGAIVSHLTTGKDVQEVAVLHCARPGGCVMGPASGDTYALQTRTPPGHKRDGVSMTLVAGCSGGPELL